MVGVAVALGVDRNDVSQDGVTGRRVEVTVETDADRRKHSTIHI